MSDDKETFHTDSLLTMVRLPDRFYTLVTGDGHKYTNPGRALKSFIVARGLRRELLTLSGSELQCARECIAFNSNKNILEKIIRQLTESATHVINQANALDAKKRNDLFGEVSSLNQHAQMAKMAWDSVISVQTSDTVDLNHMAGINFRHCLCELQDKIEQLTDMLTAMTDSPKELA